MSLDTDNTILFVTDRELEPWNGGARLVTQGLLRNPQASGFPTNVIGFYSEAPYGDAELGGVRELNPRVVQVRLEGGFPTRPGHSP